ncbi:MAG TPA: hypothetical protein VGI15_03260 [Candidatus Cybelea sp.]
MTACDLAMALACRGEPTAAAPSPQPVASAQPRRFDVCGGSQELLKKYLSASPCVFVAGQASVQSTYSGTNVPAVIGTMAHGRTSTVTIASHAFGYPGVLLNIGVSPTSQVTIVLPSFSQITTTQNGTVAGAADTEYRYKQLVYSDPKRGILGGVLATYQAPTGSPGLTAPGPSYEINPLLNVALNKARSIGENVSFPIANNPSDAGSGAPRAWTFAPQAVTFWRSPGGTLLAAVFQYGFSTNTLYFTVNSAQLLTRNLQLQATYGGNSEPVDYVNPVENIRGSGTAYSRSYTIGVNYLVGTSELPPR